MPDSTNDQPLAEGSGSVPPPVGKGSTRPEKRPLSIWRRLFRLLLVMLIVFGLGAILVIFTLYIPQREQLQRAENRIEELSLQKQDELQAANEEIQRLTTIEDRYGITQAQADQLQLQNLVLKIKLDVISARLALVSDDPGEASQALSETKDRIAELKELVGDQEQRNIENLDRRLDLVLSEIEEETFAAISDLEVMQEILEDLGA